MQRGKMIRQYNKAKRKIRRGKKKIRKFLKKYIPGYRQLLMLRKKWWGIRFAYFESIDENLVLFRAQSGRRYSGTPKLIYEYMLTDPAYQNFKFVWLVNNKNDFKFLNDNDRTRAYSVGTKKGVRIFEKAHYLIINQDLREYEKIREKQILIFDPEEYYGSALYLKEAGDEWIKTKKVFKYAKYMFASNPVMQEQIKKICGEYGKHDVKIIEESLYMMDMMNVQPGERKYRNFDIPEERKKVLLSLSEKFKVTPQFLDEIKSKYEHDIVFLIRKKPQVVLNLNGEGYQIDRQEEIDSVVEQEAETNIENTEECYDEIFESLPYLLCPAQITRGELFQLSDIIITDKCNEALEAEKLGKNVLCITGTKLTEEGIEQQAFRMIQNQYPAFRLYDETDLASALNENQTSVPKGIADIVYPNIQPVRKNIIEQFVDPTLGSTDSALKAYLRSKPALFSRLKKVNQFNYRLKAARKKLIIGTKELLKNADLKLLYVYYTFTGYFRGKGINFSANAKELYTYKNKHQGERCFLVGNGPSLNTHDLELIQNEVTFGCNRVYKMFPDTTWRPTYFCMIDALIAKYSSEELAENVTCPLFTNINTRDLMKVLPKHLIFARNLGEKPYRVSDNFEAYYVPSGATVMTFMIELAMYMGFKEIYLIGVDCTSSLAAGGHCAKGYVNPELIQKDIERVRKRLNDPTLTAEQVAAYYFDQSTFSYKVLREYADKKDIHIYNATRGGMLEVYERKNLDEVVGNKNVR